MVIIVPINSSIPAKIWIIWCVIIIVTVSVLLIFWTAHIYIFVPGRLAQSVTCLATDASLTADAGVASLIPAQSHTVMEIDCEIISTVILLPSAESRIVVSICTKYWLTACSSLPRKKCGKVN